MHRMTARSMAIVAALASVVLSAGCAQQVGDIDRTNPNKLQKSDFTDGAQWHFRQTIADVPSTNAFFFTGLSTGLEKITWEITEDALIGYRAYELVPGADPEADLQGVGATVPVDGRGEGYNPEVYKGSPVVAYSIASHFDVQRQYNTATGEQSNLIVENTTDRYWNDREYMRVDWSANQLSNINFFDTDTTIQYQHWYGEEDPNASTFKIEYGEYVDADGTTREGPVYIEFTTKAIILPSIACYYYYEADCGPTEVEVVNSFSRAPAKQTYEMVEYDNADMAKFGYFRTERVTYDRKRGVRRSGQIFLPNKHDIWETSFQDDGQPLEMSKRAPKPVVYYMNDQMPEELAPYNEGMADEWDRAFVRAAAAAKKVTPEVLREQMLQANLEKHFPGVDSLNEARSEDKLIAERAEGRMFVLCHSPVRDTDHVACGEEGLEVSVGDVRYNHVYWVADPQLQGPLGYGPSAADPETGEIISGTAYVYGASVDTYASRALDIVKLVLACVDEDGNDLQGTAACDAEIDKIRTGENVRVELSQRIKGGIDPRLNVSSALDRPIRSALTRTLSPQQRVDVEATQLDPRPADPGFEARRLDAIRDNNLDLMMLNDPDLVRGLTGGQHDDVTQLPQDTLDAIRPANWMAPTRIARMHEDKINHFARNNIMREEFVNDAVIGLALALAREARQLPADARDDFMWEKLRGLIYKAVMEHEVGHTVGLRHNFQGSYDSINFFDGYWDLRTETFNNLLAEHEALATSNPEAYASWVEAGKPNIFFLSDILKVAATTPNQQAGRVVNADGSEAKQLDGSMVEYQYSSIMDYGLQFNTDIQGLGRYDEAAILYAYTEGYDGRFNTENERVKDSGYVEVFTDEAWANAQLDDDGNSIAANLLRSFGGNTSLAYTSLLEGLHYMELVDLMGGPDALRKRSIARFDDLQRDREAHNAKIERLREQGVEDLPVADYAVEVPYMFCTDDWVSVDHSCQRWDAGADPYEQVTHSINLYRDNYIFDNFARDSLTFSPSAKVGSTYSRRLALLTNVYQSVFFTPSFSDVSFQYRWMAANAGLNLIAEILLTPTYGNYVLDKDDMLVSCFDRSSDRFPVDEACTDNENPECEFTSTSDKCSNGDYDFEVPMGVGRYPYTRYDYGSGHEYYRYPTESGHFYDYLAAILAITSSTAVIRGVDVDTDALAYSIPYTIVFEDSITRLFNAIWLENQGDFAPSVTAEGGLTPYVLSPVQLGNEIINPETGETIDPDTNKPEGLVEGETYKLMPTIGYGNRFYALLYGMAFFSSNNSLNFADNNKIFRIGAGEQVQPGPGYEQVEFIDERTGITYAAVQRASVDSPTAAVSLLRRTNANQVELDQVRVDFTTAEFALNGRLNGLIDGLNALIEVDTNTGGVLEDEIAAMVNDVNNATTYDGIIGAVNEFLDVVAELQELDGLVLDAELEAAIEGIRVSNDTLQEGLDVVIDLNTRENTLTNLIERDLGYINLMRSFYDIFGTL